MALSRVARKHAAEIANHDWSDAPYRLDRAGHQREDDTNRGEKFLSPEEAQRVKVNVAWVVAQVLAEEDPNFNVVEFARLCGIHDLSAGWLENGLRRDSNGRYLPAPEV
ncbi:hypothetical protein ACFYY8_31730 [Streptosporangium sp. NPDC001559]|uniref:hypothetical protein n=1 Tax=Streptosporangium sp. NPDC001559 TaxID=3366187 RepID=UPI0036E69C6F